MLRRLSLCSPSSVAALVLALGMGAAVPALAAPPADVHPRLWVRPADLPELKKRVAPSNPVYEDGLRKIVADSIQKMDAAAPGDLISADSGAWSLSYEKCSELYAQVFAFMYLLSPDGSPEKADHGKRAKTLLMNVIDKVHAGLAKLPEGTTLSDMAPGGAKYYGEPWVGGEFPLNLRTFIQDSIPLTVDWIYPLLNADDKAKIRTVFLYWSRLITEKAGTTGERDHPKPPGLYNDPALLELSDPNRSAARFGLNNWFAMHMRLLGLMSLAMDAADDVPRSGGPGGNAMFKGFRSAPAGALRDYLKSATGAYLYMVDYGHRNDGRGGISPEGMEYFSAGLAPAAQFHLALKTSGWDDPDLYPQKQPQVVLTGDPFWKDLYPAFVSQLSPVPVKTRGFEWYGPVYQPAWYGDGEKYLVSELVFLFGVLGRYYELSGDTKQAQISRWLTDNVSPGGEKEVVKRVRGALHNGSTRIAILYFLANDPNARPIADPRPTMPTTWFSPGLNALSVRTGWDESARWLSYSLPWSRIDHQHGEGNMIQLFRKGEWLTKKWVGYGGRSACSDFANTITVQNDPPKYNSPGSYQNDQWQAGSQWQYINSGDPLLVGWSDAPDYTYSYGDATPLYNSSRDGATQTAHVSRSLVWLKPDHYVVYDRVASRQPDRFKRFWLNFENDPKIEGNLVTGSTSGGQQLFLRTLLPEKVTHGVKSDHPMWEGGSKQTAAGEPMAFRLMVEAPNDQQNVRFLHVLQGADAGATADPATRLKSHAGTPFEGAVVNDTAVLFPRDFAEPASDVSYEAPAAVKRHVVTGLWPDKGYAVALKVAGDKVTVTLKAEGENHSDKGGVLVFDGAGKSAPIAKSAQGGAASLEAIRAAAAGLPAPGSYSSPGIAEPGKGAGMPAPAPTPSGAVTPPGSGGRGACGCGGAAGGGGVLSMVMSAGALATALSRRLRRRHKKD